MSEPDFSLDPSVVVVGYALVNALRDEAGRLQRKAARQPKAWRDSPELTDVDATVERIEQIANDLEELLPVKT